MSAAGGRRIFLRKEELEAVLEALRSAYTEIEAIEDDSDFYVPSGKLMDQLEDARAIIEKYLERATAGE